MENNFNYNITYYKVTNEKECHHGYQYHDGLNILQEEFNSDPKAFCVSGGFHFTDYEHLPFYFTYGIYIREIKIPSDARIVKNPMGNKWRANKIILGKRYRIKEDFEKWFDPEKFNWENYSYILVRDHWDKFDLWFDTEKFNYESSTYLAKFCSNKFDQWFNSEKFNWVYGSNHLAQFCFDKFDKWFNPEKFNWRIASGYLAEFCSNKFEKWFDPEKFYWNNQLIFLENFCSKYKHIWSKYIPT